MCSLSHNLQEALGLPIGMGSNDSLAGNSKGEEVLGTKETQEEEEETTSPIFSSNPFPSPSPTPEDTISYICEYPEARMACLSITDLYIYISQTYQGSPRSPPQYMPVKSPNH